jgi:arylformamidase
MRFIDISLPVDASLPVWPGDPPIEIGRFLDMNTGDAVNASRLSFSAHTGTHVDAPLHHFVSGAGADQIRLADLIGPAVVVDIPGVPAVDASHLDAIGLTSDVRRLLLKTDNCRIWCERRPEFQREFVALTPAAAAWIVARGIRLVGIDYMSIESFGVTVPIVHRTLLTAGVVVLEGLDLNDVWPGCYELICLPLRVGPLDGAPARAILVDDGRQEGAA